MLESYSGCATDVLVMMDILLEFISCKDYLGMGMGMGMGRGASLSILGQDVRDREV